jgi:hypothetical protein
VYGENCLKGVCVPFPTVDLDSHGHWGHPNLIEGNVGHLMAAADWWGPCPSNVFFKNRATVDGVALKYASDNTLLLDNAVAKYKPAFLQYKIVTFVQVQRGKQLPAEPDVHRQLCVQNNAL